MADSAGELSFEFSADFSGFSRAAESAGQKLDQLGQAAARWSAGTSAALTKPFDVALTGPLALTSAMARASQGLGTPPAAAKPVATMDDATAAKELSHLADQLALLRTTGAAHDAIVERMKVETEQAKLGTDATTAQKQAVAGLVAEIDAAKTAQSALKAQQSATNDAWSFGSDQVARGVTSLILRGARVQDVTRSLLTNVAQQGLSAALTGSGSLAGLFGTTGRNGQTGGLFGALQGLFAGGLGGTGDLFGGLLGQKATGLDQAFSGLYAAGGTLGSGQWGIVGEKGAEVVAGPATVVPVGRMAAPARTAAQTTHQTINFNVSSPDAPSFARSENQMAALLARAVGRGQRNS